MKAVTGKRTYTGPKLKTFTIEERLANLSDTVNALSTEVRRIDSRVTTTVVEVRAGQQITLDEAIADAMAKLHHELRPRMVRRHAVMQRAEKLLRGMAEAGPSLIWSETWLKMVRELELELALELQS